VVSISGEFLLQFVSKDFQYLTQQKKLSYKGISLKCSYLIDIINQLLQKYYFSNNIDTKFNLSSTILRKRYGEHYNYYIEYLCEHGFMSLVSKYYVGKKTNSYKLDSKYIYDVIRYKNFDNFLLKKDKKRNRSSIADMDQSTIPADIREKLVESLFKINIDFDGSLAYLNQSKKDNLIDDAKYYKNLISIESINTRNIYFNFDDYGRLHTNFTILKKEIRNEFISINNEMITEVDVDNSQPLFFAVLLKKELPEINGDTQRYFDLVKSGLLYDDILEKSDLTEKKEAKELVYKVLFGNNKNNRKDNKIFKKLYPSIYEYILEFKELRKNYKELSHELQKMESKFIFNDVIREIYDTYPQIIFFTVHDSIIFPMSYKDKIESIFYKHFENLIKNF